MQPSENLAIRRKILNVDDSEAKRYVTSRTLRNAGYDVIEAATGQESLELAIDQRPDLIVLDVLLPDLHGFDVCNRLKSDPRTSNIPVLHLSASVTGPEDKLKGYEHGADAYMVQPVDPLEFTATIKSLLRMVQAERDLRDAQQRLQLASQKVGLGTWEWNIDRDEILWSESLAALHGLEKTEPFRSLHQWLELIHPEDHEKVRQAIEAAMAGQKDYDIEYRAVHPNGSVRWIAARGAIFRDESGRPVRMVGISLNITIRKHAEDAVKETQRLVGAGRMAASVAHEINNPLAAIVNVMYLLGKNTSLDQDACQLVEWADRELARVAYIVSQTLGFYKQSDHPVTVKLQEAVQDVLELLRKKIEIQQIDVTVSFRAPGAVHGNYTEVRQIVSNLIINSLEAMPHQGRLAVRVTPSRDWRDLSRRGVRLYVHDSGPGIPSGARGQIFEPFFSTKVDKGTGLGLWVIRSLVERYGGSIHMRSTVGPHGGTSFSVFLPVTADLERTQPRYLAASQSSSHKPARTSTPRPRSVTR
jgi:two-component system, NtrC family, sensor kinase